jgi:hypothetical protein
MNTDNNKETANIIADAINDLVVSMPASCQPYDYSLELKGLRHELSDVASQLERIADLLESKGGK